VRSDPSETRDGSDEQTVLDAETPPDTKPTHGGRRPGSGRKRTHALSVLRQTVTQLGHRPLDGRTTLSKQLAAWKANLIADLGGPDAITTAQHTILALAAKTKLMLDSVDGWLLTQPSLVNARRKSLLPVVRERMQLSDALARYLTQLGLERKAKEVNVAEAFAALHQTERVREAPSTPSTAPSTDKS